MKKQLFLLAGIMVLSITTSLLPDDQKKVSSEDQTAAQFTINNHTYYKADMRANGDARRNENPNTYCNSICENNGKKSTGRIKFLTDKGEEPNRDTREEPFPYCECTGTPSTPSTPSKSFEYPKCPECRVCPVINPGDYPEGDYPGNQTFGDNNIAQNMCPGVCSQFGLAHNGNWKNSDGIGYCGCKKK
jgi:hypothetical protein